MPFKAPRAKPAGFNPHRDRDRLRARRSHGLGRHYDSPQWRNRTRPYILSRDPLCKIADLCEGRDPSTDADHVIPAADYVAQHGGDESFFYDTTNLQGACHACHTAKTARGG